MLCQGPTAGCEIRLPGLRSRWVVRLSDVGREGSLEAFARRVTAGEVSLHAHHDITVRMRNLVVDVIDHLVKRPVVRWLDLAGAVVSLIVLVVYAGLVGLTGWQGLFWIDALVAALGSEEAAAAMQQVQHAGCEGGAVNARAHVHVQHDSAGVARDLLPGGVRLEPHGGEERLRRVGPSAGATEMTTERS